MSILYAFNDAADTNIDHYADILGESTPIDIKEEVLNRAWKASFPYRSGRNLYNSEFYDEILESCLNKAEIMDLSKNQLKNVPKQNRLFPILFLAVCEAMERPLHNDPVFAHPSDSLSLSAKGRDGNNYTVKSSDILISCHSFELSNFLYPVGFQNYAVNRGLYALFEKNEDDISSSVLAKLEAFLAPAENESSPHLEVFINCAINEFKHAYKAAYKKEYPYVVSYAQNWVGPLSKRIPMIRFIKNESL